MASLNSSSIGTDDVNILKLFMGLRRTGPVAKALAQIFILLSQLGNRSVKEYCIDILGYSNKAFTSSFTLAERTLLDGVWDPMEMDTTMLYKLLQRVCGLASPGDTKWHTSADTIEYYLYSVKRERNELAHEGVQINDTQLNNKYSALEDIIGKLFDRTSEMLFSPGNDTTKFKCAALSSLKDILKAKVITPKTIEDCRALLKAAKEETLTRVILLARRELHHKYQTLKSASPITWASHFSQDIMDINQLFTELELEDSQTPVTLEDMLLLSSVVILQGLPGAGKSAVVRFFANCWCNSSSQYQELNRKDILLLIQCRYVTSDDLVSFLKDEILSDSLEHVASEDVVSLLKGAELYICMDGYDEAGPKAKDLLRQMLKLFPDAHFLLTTRPEFTDDLKIESHRYFKVDKIPVINILGFNETNRKEYVKKVFKHLKEGSNSDNSSSVDIDDPLIQESLEGFYKFLTDKEGLLGTLTRLPLTLAFLVILWVDDAENITDATTTTQIYHKLIELMIRRLVDRLRQRPEERRTSDILRRKCHKWIIELGKEAWTALKSNQTCLNNSSTDILMDKCDELGLDVTEIFSTLLISDTQGNLTTSSLVWSFFHKTLQEFLAALFISHTATEADCNIDETFINEKKTKLSIFGKHKNVPSTKVIREKLNVEDSNTILSFVSGILSEAGKITTERAKSIVRVAEIAGGQKRFLKYSNLSKTTSKVHALLIARILLETNAHPDIVKEVSHMQFTIDKITADDCYFIHPLLDHTESIMDTYVTIEVRKVNTDIVGFVGESCRKLPHFKPTFKFTNLEDMKTTLTLLSQLDLANYNNNFSVDLHFYTDRLADPMAKDQHLVIPPLLDFPFYIQRNLKQIIAAHDNLNNKNFEDNSEKVTIKDLYNLRYEIIGIVHTEQAVLTDWLLSNTQCRLSNFITFDGSSVSKHTLKILKYSFDKIWYFQPRIRWLKSIHKIHNLVKFLKQLGTSDHIQNNVFLSLSYSSPLAMRVNVGAVSRPKGTKSMTELLLDHPHLANNIAKKIEGKASANYHIHEYINEVLPDQVGIANWLVRNTLSRLANDLTIHVEKVTQDILDLITWEYEHWSVKPYFKFRSLSDLLKGAQRLVNHLQVRNKQNYEYDALVSISFSAPTSLPANSVPPYPPLPPPVNLFLYEQKEHRRRREDSQSSIPIERTPEGFLGVSITSGRM